MHVSAILPRWVVGAVAALAATIALASPASATGAEHAFFPEEFDGSEHFAAGEGFCVPWAGTFHEVRHGGYRLVAAPGGRDPGELHINGVIDGLVELVPDSRSLPTYTGTYREKVTGVVVLTGDAEDIERVGSFRLRSTLHGTDGSTLQLVLSGHVTVNGTGEQVVDRTVFTCE